MSVQFGGEGQARRPRFKPNDIVHVLASSTSSPVNPSTSTMTTTTTTTTAPELLPSTSWRITSLTPSPSITQPHLYTLTPTRQPTITVPEQQIHLAPFTPGDIVVKIENGLIYRVLETRVVETMKPGRNGKKEVEREVWCVLQDEVGVVERDVTVELLRKAEMEKGERWWPVDS